LSSSTFRVKPVFDSLSQLKYITIESTGFDGIDLQSAKEHNIKISNIPDYSTEAVAEMTISLMFATTRHIAQLNTSVHEKPYEIDPADQNQLQFLGFNLQGKTLGIIGLGKIGQRVAEMANGIGMKVIAYNHSEKNIPNVKQETLEELLRQSDIISLHTPLNNTSENMISSKEFEIMKSNAVIINTARGKVIDQQALINALKNKQIAGAGLDTLANWDKTNPIFSLENVIITPHGAWYTRESFENLANTVVENIEEFAAGHPQNLIT
jgi:glycerate dehydrogenase